MKHSSFFRSKLHFSVQFNVSRFQKMDSFEIQTLKSFVDSFEIQTLITFEDSFVFE
jgi:hypothetical protein